MNLKKEIKLQITKTELMNNLANQVWPVKPANLIKPNLNSEKLNQSSNIIRIHLALSQVNHLSSIFKMITKRNSEIHNKKCLIKNSKKSYRNSQYLIEAYKKKEPMKAKQ